MIKVSVLADELALPPSAHYVTIEGFSYPIKTACMPEADAVALKRELEASFFDAKHSLMVLEVVNYGMLGRSIEARMPNGESLMLAIPESQQAKVRDYLVKDRDDGAKKTAYDRVLEDE